MLGAKRGGGLQGFLPEGNRLPRNTENQVQVDIPETVFPGQAERGYRLRKSMDPSQRFQQLRAGRLHAERQAVYA